MKYGNIAVKGGLSVDGNNTVTNMFEAITGMIEEPNTGTSEYILFQSCPYEIEINDMTHQTSSGTATFDLRIDGVNVLGINGITTNSTESTDTATGENTAGVGDKVSIVVTAQSDPVNMGFTIKITRI